MLLLVKLQLYNVLIDKLGLTLTMDITLIATSFSTKNFKIISTFTNLISFSS